VVPVAEQVALAWPGELDAVACRVVILDETSGDYIKLEASEPRATVDVSELDPDHVYHWRVQVRTEDGGPWEDVMPYVRLLLPRAGGETTTLRWDDDGAVAYRVIVRDESIGEIVVKDGVLGTEYPVDWSALDARHSYRYRIQAAEGTEWVDRSGYLPMSAPHGARVRSALDGGAPNVGGGELILLFTVDTEVSMRQMRVPDPALAVDQQIFAVHEGREVGIRYLMDLLDRFGYKGTFFVDILLEYQLGPGSLAPAIAAIKERGHDIQLHLHPAPHLRFADDPGLRRLWPAMASDDVDLFRAALEAALEMFDRLVGTQPVAYRSGAYHITDAFFPVLSEYGLRIDTSIYPFKNCRVSPWMQARTQPFWIGDVLEIPVSWLAYERDGLLTPQQVAAVTSGSVQHPAFAGMPAPAGAPPTTLVYLAHSNSLLRKERCFDEELLAAWNRRAAEIWTPEEYDFAALPPGTELVFVGEPDETRIDVLERGLETLAARGDVRGLSLQELHDEGLDRWSRPAGPTEPIAVSRRAGQATFTGLRRYSAGFLDHLDREARSA
jgi:hypothetical protein